MFKFDKLTYTEKILFSGLLIILILSAYFGFTDADYFNLTFAKEDGAVEYGTFFFLFCIGILQFYRLFSNGKAKPVLWKLSILFLGLHLLIEFRLLL